MEEAPRNTPKNWNKRRRKTKTGAWGWGGTAVPGSGTAVPPRTAGRTAVRLAVRGPCHCSTAVLQWHGGPVPIFCLARPVLHPFLLFRAPFDLFSSYFAPFFVELIYFIKYLQK
uniref:Uncharacterized protein n=1 Tax=Opuntia streptacantha TaxID=393608 RepID=A0A7C9A9Z5_OPUST